MIIAGQVSLTADGAVRSGPGALAAVNICGGADAATVTLYDNTEGSGTVVTKLGVAAGASASYCPAQPIAVGRGIYAVITGATPQVNVAYL